MSNATSYSKRSAAGSARAQTHIRDQRGASGKICGQHELTKVGNSHSATNGGAVLL